MSDGWDRARGACLGLALGGTSRPTGSRKTRENPGQRVPGMGRNHPSGTWATKRQIRYAAASMDEEPREVARPEGLIRARMSINFSKSSQTVNPQPSNPIAT